MSAYATKNSAGTFDIFQGGNKVSTGAASVLSNYGLSETNLGTPAAAPAIPPASPDMPSTPIPTPTPATYINPNAGMNLPQPTAPAAHTQYQIGLAESVERAQSTLSETQKTERDESLKRTEELYGKLEKIQSETDPEMRATYEQEQRITQDQLNAAENASKTLTEDFNTRRKIVGELESILTEGNAYVESLRGFGGVSFIRNARVQEATALIQARAGVLQATLAGLDGNVALAHSLINNARNAVAANWNDEVAYNEAVLKLVSSKELTLDKIEEDYAATKVSDAKASLERLTKTSELISEAMVDPELAKTFSQAGITLMDTPEQISKKLGDHAYSQEVRDLSNEMASDGYSFLSPGQQAPAGSSVVTVTDSKGLQKNYYKKGSSTGGAGTKATEAERQTAAVSQFQSAFVPGASLDDGTPILDNNGFITPLAWKAAIADAPAEGLSRQAFINQFGHLLYSKGGKIDPQYGLTAQEQKLITGVLE